MNFNLDPNDVLVFANAFEMVVMFCLFLRFLYFMFSEVEGLKDLYRRFTKILRRDFQGGYYDLAVALMCLFLAMAVRSEVPWEWRVFDTEFRSWQLMAAVAFKAVAGLCVLRVVAPSDHFHKYWIVAFGVALAFASGSVWLG